jgi:hypothetical protein
LQANVRIGGDPTGNVGDEDFLGLPRSDACIGDDALTENQTLSLNYRTP